MKTKHLFTALTFLTLTFLVISCSSDDEPAADDNAIEEEIEDETGTKPTATSIRFAANGKDCGITDGFADQQHALPSLIHLNLDKCNGETFRPTLTLNFEQGQTIEPGTYTLATSGLPGANEFVINSYKYNYTDWVGTAGSVVVVTNADDATKIDIELKSITMANQNSEDTLNPATDTLTGYIIKI